MGCNLIQDGRKSLEGSALDIDQDRFHAGINLIRRTGAIGFQVRVSDEEEPTVWMAIAKYIDGRAEVDASLDPLRAVLRLCERLCDGGMCNHCKRPCGLEPDSIDTMPMNNEICWYQYDPELKTFRRGCEGD